MKSRDCSRRDDSGIFATSEIYRIWARIGSKEGVREEVYATLAEKVRCLLELSREQLTRIWK